MTHLPIQRSPVKLIYKLKTCLLIYLFLSTKKAPKITNLKTYVWKKPQTVHCNGNFRLWHITIKTFAFIFTERATFNFFSNSLKVSRIPAVLTQVFTHLAHQNSSKQQPRCRCRRPCPTWNLHPLDGAAACLCSASGASACTDPIPCRWWTWRPRTSPWTLNPSASSPSSPVCEKVVVFVNVLGTLI